MKQKSLKPEKTSPETSSSFWLFIAAIAIILITYTAYLPAQKNKFTNWDDDRYVVENKDIKSLQGENFSKLLQGYYEGNYHPLTMFSYALNYQSGKLNPKGYIQTNIWLHILNTVLVLLLIQMLIRQTTVSFIASLLFGIHPLHVESVAWISERKDVLYCFFFLLSMIAYVYYCRKQQPLVYVLSLTLFVLSLLSKAMAAPLAITLLLIDYLHNRKLLSWKILYEKIPFVLIAGGFGILAIKAQQVKEINPGDFQYSFIERIAIAGNGFSQYIGKLVFPYKLSALYPYPDEIPYSFWLLTMVACTAVIALSFYWIKNQDRNSYAKVYLSGLWFFILNVALVLQLLPVGKAMMADRYTYVASIGFFWMIGTGIFHAGKIIKGKVWMLFIPLGIYAVFLFHSTQKQCKIWNNSISLWDNVIRHYPNADIAYLNRGLAKHHKGERIDAINDYKKAVELNPSMHLAWNNLGSIHSEMSKHHEALPYFTKAIQLDSGFANTWMNRAKTRAELKDYKGAIDDYTRYLQSVPDNPDVLNDRGLAYYQLSDYGKAKEDYDRAIMEGEKVNSNKMGIYYLNRGLCLAFLKDFSKAFEDYNQALQLHPNPGTVLYNRGILYCFTGDFNKGCEDLKNAERSGMKEATEKINSYCSR